jgi:hypothetical protein
MARKPRMTVTSRFLDERRPLAARHVRSPFPNPPPNRSPIGRLCFCAPSPKLDCSAADLVRTIGVGALPDAAVFLDTNIFTTEMDTFVWDALYTKRVFITPGVWKELLPWLETPFCNTTVRDRVLAAVRNQVSSASNPLESPRPQGQPPSCDIAKMEVLFDKHFTNHGYEYYLKLLALRKAMGPQAVSVLTNRFGKAPTHDQFLAEVQGQLGPRGFLIARKGLEAANSPNRLTDEQLVVMAVLTAIVRGTEAFIITRDADVLEQYFKVLSLMKEHYRAMHVKRYAANPHSMPFREVPIHSDGVSIPEFSGTSVLQLETTDVEFNPLPTRFNFVNIYCLLLGGKASHMRVTFSSFCAEKEMAQMLKVKARACIQLRRIVTAANCTPARKFLASLS